MKVGMASVTEKMKVAFHLLMVRLWLMPDRPLPSVYMRAVKPAPCWGGVGWSVVLWGGVGWGYVIVRVCVWGGRTAIIHNNS